MQEAEIANASTNSPHAGLTYRGVNYDTGTDYGRLGGVSRRYWSTELVRREIHAIRTQLHCDSVNITGAGIDRLVAAATIALEDGLHVWLQPRVFDRSQDHVLAHLAETARQAERLRQRYGAVGLNLGVELSVFAPGMIPGESFIERIKSLTQTGIPQYMNDRLNVFLGQALSVARSHFNGEVTYGSGSWEEVDWSDFDIVGLDSYPGSTCEGTKSMADLHAEVRADLQRARRWDKPIAIVEFGTTTSGVGDLDLVDWSLRVPEIRGAPPARNEPAQADYIIALLEIFEAENLHAAYAFEFIETTHPHASDPRFDIDRAGYDITKVVRHDHADPASLYRWEPKQAFHAFARHNKRMQKEKAHQ